MIPGNPPASNETSVEKLARGVRSLFEGGVGGPSTAGTVTDNAVMRWDGTDGRTAQNSTVTVDDSGNTVIPGTLAVTGTTTLSGALDAPSLPLRGMQYFSASGTFNVPANVSKVWVWLWGGGGGSGGTDATHAGAGGGAGEFAMGIIAVTPGGTATVTIGAGGTKGSLVGPTGGTAGGTSTFAGTTSMTALGGSPSIAAGGIPGGAGGSGGTGGSFRFVGGAGQSNTYVNFATTAAAGAGGQAFGIPVSWAQTNALPPGGGGPGTTLSGANGFDGAAGGCLVIW